MVFPKDAPCYGAAQHLLPQELCLLGCSGWAHGDWDFILGRAGPPRKGWSNSVPPLSPVMSNTALYPAKLPNVEVS